MPVQEHSNKDEEKRRGVSVRLAEWLTKYSSVTAERELAAARMNTWPKRPLTYPFARVPSSQPHQI